MSDTTETEDAAQADNESFLALTRALDQISATRNASETLNLVGQVLAVAVMEITEDVPEERSVYVAMVTASMARSMSTLAKMRRAKAEAAASPETAAEEPEKSGEATKD